MFVLFEALAVFLVFATIKCWVRWKGGSPIASMTAFHDFQPKDKQEAIEYVIEEKAGKKMEEQESGENVDEEMENSTPNPPKADKSQIRTKFN